MLINMTWWNWILKRFNQLCGGQLKSRKSVEKWERWDISRHFGQKHCVTRHLFSFFDLHERNYRFDLNKIVTADKVISGSTQKKPNCLRLTWQWSLMTRILSHVWTQSFSVVLCCLFSAISWNKGSHDYSFSHRRAPRKNKQRIVKGNNGRTFRSLLSLVQRNRTDQDNWRVSIKYKSCYLRFWSGRNKKSSSQTATSYMFAKRSWSSSVSAFKRLHFATQGW